MNKRVVVQLCLLQYILAIQPHSEGVYKVYRLVPTDNQQLQRLIDMFETVEGDSADFWHAPSVVNATVDVMVSPLYQEQFSAFLRKHSYPHHVAIEDLKQMLIEKESSLEVHDKDESALLRDFSIRYSDDGDGFASKLKMGEYYSYAIISGWMRRIAEKLPHITKVIDIGSSIEGRRILGMKFGIDSPEKKVIVIDAGIHAREWASIHTAMYFINTLVNSRESNSKISDYLDNVVIYIFPLLNPDGYEYTRTDRTNPRARMWRKSRSLKECAFDGIGNSCCEGVDLNRNFAFRFSEIGASRYPCSEIYHGKKAFSEPETIAFSNFMLSLKGRIDAYITLHAYSQLFIYSYSHRKFTYAPDIEDTRRVAKNAVKAIGEMYGTKYQYGTGPEIIYAFSGGSTDWAKETLKVKYSYTIELRPTYEEWNGFVLDKDQLIPTAKETWAGVEVVIDQVLHEWRQSRKANVARSEQQLAKCADRLAGCSAWIKTSPEICSRSPQSMARDCARTCQLCHLIRI